MTGDEMRKNIERERRPALSTGGKIAPYGESFQELIGAVWEQGKPIAEFDYDIYKENQDFFDALLRERALEKTEDLIPQYQCVWIFNSHDKENAMARINSIKAIDQKAWRRGYFTLTDHKEKGRLFGYSEADVEGFISWRTFVILRAYLRTGEGKLEYFPPQAQLTSNRRMSNGS